MSDFNYEEALQELDRADASIARMKEAIDAYSSNIKKMHEENAEKRAARELQVA